MVTAGLAIALPDYSDAYVDLAEKARSERLGIWAAEFQIPADYRAANASPEGQARTTNAQPRARKSVKFGLPFITGTVTTPAQLALRLHIAAELAIGWRWTAIGMESRVSPTGGAGSL
jgi:hypothetical protein